MSRFEYVVDSFEKLPHAFKWASELVRMGLPGGPMAIYVDRPRRSLDQNALMWATLHDISEQVEWHGQKLSEDDWKTVFTAALKKYKVVPGIDGGFVVLGLSTSKMNREEFSELLELIFSFGTEHGVIWSDESGKGILKEAKA